MEKTENISGIINAAVCELVLLITSIFSSYKFAGKTQFTEEEINEIINYSHPLSSLKSTEEKKNEINNQYSLTFS
jgi:hypothetical protein